MGVLKFRRHVTVTAKIDHATYTAVATQGRSVAMFTAMTAYRTLNGRSLACYGTVF